MRTLRFIVFLVVALAQIAVPASMIWKRQQTLRNGRTWKFRTVPVDPVDALRGRYLTLRFDAETFERQEGYPYQSQFLRAKLKEDADGFAIVDDLTENAPLADDVIPAQNLGFYERKMRVQFTFDEFWINETDAAAAETLYTAHSRGQDKDSYVTVRVKNGDAAIEEFYLGDKPLREVARAARR
ncbi:MAG: GDYXXLXY domain-containing protein [Chthoniobacterales bacterium]